MSGTRWTRPAQNDLAAIDRYCFEEYPDSADRVGRKAIAAGRFLAAHPFADAEAAEGWRRWRVRGTPYLLIYRVFPGRIEIVRVRHVRQDWPDLP